MYRIGTHQKLQEDQNIPLREPQMEAISQQMMVNQSDLMDRTPFL